MDLFTRLLPPLAPLALALAGCSPEAEEPAQQQVQAPAPTAPASPTPSATPDTGTLGGDGSQIQLAELTEADFAANPLEGELGCSFLASEGAAPILAAKGFVADETGRAQALARIGSSVERSMASVPGGFDGIISGARFGGRGMTYTVTLDESQQTPSGESPALPARLLLQRADGAERTIAGTWTCGP